MKDNIKINNAIDGYSSKDMAVAVFNHLAVAIAAAVAARGIILDKLLPFGIAFLTASPVTFIPASAVGAFVSYFIPAAGNSGFRYIAAVFAATSIRLMLSSYKKLQNNPLFLTIISFLATVLTGAVTVKTGDMQFTDLLCEGVLCAAGTFFIHKFFSAVLKERPFFSTDELSALLITASIVLMGIFNFSFMGVSLGRILGLLLILTAAKYGGILAGTISGTTVGFAMLLSGVSGNICMTYAIAGLISAIFTSIGKYAQITVLIIFNMIGAISTGNFSAVTQTLFESSLAGFMFAFIPKRLGLALGKLFFAYPHLAMPEGIKKSFTMRLQLASNALKDVSHTVEQVSEELSKINAPDYNNVINAIEQDACVGCNLRLHCWEARRTSTVDAIHEMTKAVKSGDSSPETYAPDEFKGRCVRLNKVGNVTFKKYSEFASKIAAENRIEEVRSVVSDQFDGIADMLKDLSLDFENDENFDNATAENTASALKNLNIRVSEASCRIDKYDRMTLEYKLKKCSDLVINKMQVMKLISITCGRDFDVPNISEIGNDIYITLKEKAALTIDCGIEQICADKSTMCGDACKCFNDGKGHFIMVLSDGMGTGGRAAVDGAMACGLMSRLIKAGFGYDCSLKLLNSSMLFKSTDESLATVDVASIDLFTGQTELYKAGAAPTVIRRSGRAGKAESTSLPAGILRDISFDKATIKCREGDVVVLMSDGVITDGTDWIKAEVESWRDGTAQELAEKISQGAIRRRTDNHCDDITVITAIITKSV